MFTGIIEETGVVKSFKSCTNGAKMVVTCARVLSDVKVGDSIAINGVCQTVVSFDKNSFCIDISEETLNVTTFKNVKQGDIVNLERALTLNSRLGGHIVTGHVDCIAEFFQIEKFGEFYNLQFKIPQNVLKYIVYKGSVTINGISLTVADITDEYLNVAIIPHTFNNTNLLNLKRGDFVNIETDILAKYIEKMLLLKHKDDTTQDISMEFLKENGFV